MAPPHCLTWVTPARMAPTSRSWAAAIAAASANASKVMTPAATIKATKLAAAPPAVKVIPARPARIGPVQPKPASK
jgi:hypothetical protein